MRAAIRPHRPAAALLTAALSVAAADCGGPSSGRPPDPFADLPVWTLAAEPELRIGRFDGPPQYTFAGVMDAGLAGDTLVVVADGGANEIRLYARDGSFVRALGRQGSGPGEFQNLWRIHIGDGTVAGWDQRLMRLSTFGLDGELVRSIRWTAPPGEGLPSFVGLLEDGSGFARLRGGGDHETMMNRPDGVFREAASYALCGPDGACETVYTGPGDERLVSRGDHGFEIGTPLLGRASVATVLSGALIVGSTDSLHLERIAADGAREPILRHHPPPRPFTEADWAVFRDRRDRWRERSREEGMPAPAPLPRPEHPTYPAFDRIEAGADGNLWVREAPEPGFARWRWWVFDPEGRPLGRLVAEPLWLVSLDTARIVAVESDELGVESVVIYPVERSSGAETP